MKGLLKAAKIKQHRTAVKIKLGINIPRNHKEEMFFDANNGNNNWKDAELLEINHIYNFYPFDSLGPDLSACILPGHTKI